VDVIIQIDDTLLNLLQQIFGSLLRHDGVVTLCHLETEAIVSMESLKPSDLHEAMTTASLLEDLAVLLSIPGGESFEAGDEAVEVFEDAEWLSTLAKIFELLLILLVETSQSIVCE
jgi:hypothetical protein